MKKSLLIILPLLLLSSCNQTMSQIGTNTLSSTFSNHASDLSYKIMPHASTSTSYPVRHGFRSMAREGFKSAIGTTQPSQPHRSMAMPAQNTALRGNVVYGGLKIFKQKLYTCSPYTLDLNMGSYFVIHGPQNGRCMVTRKMNGMATLLCAHSPEYVRIANAEDPREQEYMNRECKLQQ